VKTPHAWAWTGLLCLLLGVSLGADTLFLRNGDRVQGQLVSVRNGVVEFDAQRGFSGRERIRVDVADVTRIEFDRYDRSDNDSNNRFGGNNNDRPGGSSSSRPSGMRERAVVVNAAEQWQDSGVVVRAGQTVYFAASGRVRWGPGRQDGPDGERNSPRNDARPMPNRPAAALIARVGESNDYFFIGDDTGPIRVRGNGRLYLGINDDFLRDNSGSFRVIVYY
jgi:PA-IL-like protein